MRTLAQMLIDLEQVLEGAEERRQNAERVRTDAEALGRMLPLVHRTGPPGRAASWRTLLVEGRLRTADPCTARERSAGIERVFYCFLGCGAYPEGIVALVLDARRVLARRASYTPFDSGSLERHGQPRAAARAAAWDDAAKEVFLVQHLGSGADVLEFAGRYLAAHFRDPLDYVRRAQASEPDYPSYHGLESMSVDRRSWTIEVQVHEDLSLDGGDGVIVELVVGRRELLAEVPDAWEAAVRVSQADDRVLEAIADGIVERWRERT